MSDAIVSGSNVFAIATASNNGQTFPDQIDVFSEPAGGWSGSLTPTATLAASDGGDFFAITISDNAVIASGDSYATTADELYAFTEPLGGWTGTVHESSETKLSGNYFAIGAAGKTVVLGGTTDGTTVVAPPGVTPVYEEPTGGWTGTLQPAAMLEPPYSQLRGVDVYTEPAGGWQGLVHPTTRFPLNLEVESTASISGTTIAVASYSLPVDTPGVCPCTGNLRLFQEPSSGWPALLQAPSADPIYTDVNGATPLAFDGQTLFAGVESPPGSEVSTLEIFRIQPPIEESPLEPSPPRFGHPTTTITGLSHDQPHLQFHVHSGTYSPPLKSVTIVLPAGLEFSRNPGHLKTGVTVLGAFPKLELRQGQLVLSTLNQNYLLVKIGRPALTETRQLRDRVASIDSYDKQHRRERRTLKLTLVLHVTDMLGHATRLSVVTSVT